MRTTRKSGWTSDEQGDMEALPAVAGSCSLVGRECSPRYCTDADLGLTILAALGSVSDGGSFTHPSVGVAHSIGGVTGKKTPVPGKARGKAKVQHDARARAQDLRTSKHGGRNRMDGGMAEALTPTRNVRLTPQRDPDPCIAHLRKTSPFKAFIQYHFNTIHDTPAASSHTSTSKQAKKEEETRCACVVV